MQEQAPREYEIKKFELPDMSHSEMDDLIKSQLICRVTFNDDPYPYTLPMEYYYFGDTMYFHFTTSGKKMDLLRKNPNVTVEIDRSDSNYDQLRQRIDERQAGPGGEGRRARYDKCGHVDRRAR